jgi:uncharacterized membrane protein YdjX (TVP38/TMEM64 family)
LLVALLALAAWFRFGTEAGRSLTAIDTLARFRQLDPALQRGGFVLLYVVGCLVFIPGTLLSLVGALLFGVQEGTLWTWLGAVIGSAGAFQVARLLGRDFVVQLFRGSFERFDRAVRRNGFLGLFLIRLLPIFPFFAINFGSGITGIRFRDYVAATAAGILPGVFVYQLLFAKLGEAALKEGVRPADFLAPDVLTAIAVFIGFTIGVTALAKRLAPRE